MDDKAIKRGFLKLLKKKKVYEPEVDDALVDQIIFNLKLIEDAKTDIINRGSMVNLRKDKDEEPFYQINFSISILHNAIKSNNTLLKQLGLEKARIEVDPKDDAMLSLKALLN